MGEARQEDMWEGGMGSRCQDCMTVSVKQGESEGRGSSGWLQGERRLQEVRIKSKREGHFSGEKGLDTWFVFKLLNVGFEFDLKGTSTNFMVFPKMTA